MTEKASVLLVGAGGVGTIAALNLDKGGQANVTAVLRSNYNKVVSEGFHIKSIDHGEIKSWKPPQVLNTIPNHSSTTQFDYIVISTKNIPDNTPTTADLVSPAITPGKTIIVLIQNGLNIETPFFTKYPHNICLSGVSLIGSHETSPAFIEHDDPDRLIIGAFHNPNLEPGIQDAAAREFVRIYGAAGKTDCEYTDNVPFHRWQKLVYNACLNTICAVTGLDTGRIRLAGDVADTLVRPAMREIVAAAEACGILLPEGIVERMVGIDPLTIYLKPSMLDDVERGNLTEFENLLGEPLREGTSRGIAMPTATFLYHTLKAMQWRFKERKGLVTIPPKSV
ncbi:2-dehydropantoate 2-reductase family protein [Aspergillus cavernicola]|uniref:2-dehydropantoate 2-reductase n=1 Tax=Aspergillus cavernicola TaxID=176166 RepID=A0ABR4HMV9_9EURO